MRTVIDFNTKKTELGWQEVLDVFWKKAIPYWFDWLEWALILAAIDFVAQVTESFILRLASALSYVGIFFYFQSIFFSIEFRGLPFLKSERARRFASLVISGLLAFLWWLLLTNLISKLEGKIS